MIEMNVARTHTEDGLVCVACELDFTSPAARGVRQVPVGHDAETGCQVFACATCCGESEHQPRERAVPCRVCGRMTWNWDARCSKHGGAR